MNVSSPKTEQYAPYWDEGQRGPVYHEWFKKGFWKRALRKKFIKSVLKDGDKE